MAESVGAWAGDGDGAGAGNHDHLFSLFSNLHLFFCAYSCFFFFFYVGVFAVVFAKADEINFFKQEAEKCRRRAEAAKKQKDTLQGEQGSIQAQLSQQVSNLHTCPGVSLFGVVHAKEAFFFFAQVL